MSNLQNFDEILKSIDLESKKLKAVSDAYQKLEVLTVAYDTISKQFDQNSKALERINELQKAQQEKVAKSLTNLENGNNQNKSEISKLLEEKTDQIRKENKEFYKDIESTFKSKLDDNKSQIKQLIEHERNQIKQIFEIEFAKTTKELLQIIETETAKQTALILDNQKIIKFSLWLIGGLTLLLCGVTVFKLVFN